MLFLPNLKYRCRKYIIFVNYFGIHNLNTNNLFCYVYHEATARKTPNDVCSFLVHYINSFVDDDVEELHLFCENCAGQNKNHALLRMIMALVEIKKFKKIQVFFPQRGHSFLPCDHDFGIFYVVFSCFTYPFTIAHAN